MSETERRSALLLLAILGAAALFMTALAPLALAGLAIPVALIGAWFLLSGAARRSRTTIYLIVFLSVFLLDATFRVRDYADKGIDFQVLIKIAIWLTIAAVALFHASRWLGEILTPGNLPWILFLLWLLFTATLSPIPAYSAFTAFSICAHVAFCAYLFSNFERAEIFAVMVLALTAFCLVSIAVYFAVPEFGRFVYWLNEQRYVSPRLAGIAGSANNMGRLAAFGLILIILYASAFRRLHPLLVPVCGFTLALSLVMTNSRSSMIMVIALGLFIGLFRWSRIPHLMLLTTAVLFGALMLIPAADDVLKLVSRSGDLQEITSMTGRSEIWTAVPKIVERQSWTGFGYASSIVIIPQHEREIGFLTSHAHNLILQLLLTTGWIGVGLFCLSLLTVGGRALYTGDRTVLVLLAYVIFNGITESSAFTTVANICSLAFAIAVTLPPERREHENHPSY